jgi:alpha-mannosidase
MNRRDFARSAFVGLAALRAVAAQEENAHLWFVDGYHGGVRGHMPAGAWRDIVTRLWATPSWKLCLDIEPASWRYVAEQDPESFEQIKQYLNQPPAAARLEMVGGTFSQPYGWALTGESNIRQLVRGLEIIRATFPGLPVDTYAVQEPCWASCLPQILLSLGFKAAVLKNPSTAWGGYAVGMDAETVNWIGSDGSSIRAVPRYACEELLDTWRTEAQTGSRAFARKCIEHGIAHPAGMCFQDLGWAARPAVEGDYLRYVTWREYMQSVAGSTTRNWRFGIEDIRCALPWGEKTLQKIARQVRSAENRLIAAEKIAAMAAVRCGLPYPADDLQRASDKILWAQHHDAWITATTRSGRDAWAFQVAAETWDAEAICSDVVDKSLDRLTASPSADRAAGNNRSVHVFNTLAHDRHDLVEIEIATSVGTKSVRVLDSSGNLVPSQFDITRKYLTDRTAKISGRDHRLTLEDGESIGAVRLLFRQPVPALGQAVYTIEDSSDPIRTRQTGAAAVIAANGVVTLETDLYRIRIDSSRGGIVSSLFAKNLNKEFCGSGERGFHEFRGYFIEEKAWQSSADHPASVEVIESGPVRVTVVVNGRISSVPFRTTISLTQGQRRIDFDTQFHFEKDTWIGDPWEIKPAERMTGRRRSEYDDRYKLLALFPVSFEKNAVFKNAAFDVCRSANRDTFFNRWDEIKHNIVLNWVDVVDRAGDMGLALLSDHTTSYAEGKEHPLSLVMGWGWDGGFWWGKCPLNGLQQMKYALVPHSGLWDRAELWREAAEWSEPLLPHITAGNRSHLPATSLLRVNSPGVQLTSLTVSGNDLLARFFNAESPKDQHEISIAMRPKSVEVVELDGRVSEVLESRQKIQVRIPRFGVRTLRFSGVVL